jgi:aspartyl-tRNA(Asn)/glutamyl-tRNA(Gln) amidotransferase subunit C
MLTKEEVIKIATLSRINLTDAEVEKFQKDLSTVLDYVEELKQVNVDGLAEVSQVTGLENIMRPDEAVMSDNREFLAFLFWNYREQQAQEFLLSGGRCVCARLRQVVRGIRRYR